MTRIRAFGLLMDCQKVNTVQYNYDIQDQRRLGNLTEPLDDQRLALGHQEFMIATCTQSITVPVLQFCTLAISWSRQTP